MHNDLIESTPEALFELIPGLEEATPLEREIAKALLAWCGDHRITDGRLIARYFAMVHNEIAEEFQQHLKSSLETHLERYIGRASIKVLAYERQKENLLSCLKEDEKIGYTEKATKEDLIRCLERIRADNERFLASHVPDEVELDGDEAIFKITNPAVLKEYQQRASDQKFYSTFKEYMESVGFEGIQGRWKQGLKENTVQTSHPWLKLHPLIYEWKKYDERASFLIKKLRQLTEHDYHTFLVIEEYRLAQHRTVPCPSLRLVAPNSCYTFLCHELEDHPDSFLSRLSLAGTTSGRAPGSLHKYLSTLEAFFTRGIQPKT